MIVKKVENELDKKAVFEIRQNVFVQEQNVPSEMEIDEHDNSQSVIHLLGRHKNKPIAASRVRFVDHYAKLERIAVLKDFRGNNFGADMVKAMEKVIADNQYKKAVLNAQTYALDFYKKLGYVIDSEVFMDAGIPHVRMIKNI